MPLQGGSLDSSRVEPAIPLMIAGVATPIGNRTANVLQIVALALAEMPSVVATVDTTSSLIPATTTLSVQGLALYDMPSSKMNLSGLCSKETW